MKHWILPNAAACAVRLLKNPGVLKRSTLGRYLYRAGFGVKQMQMYQDARESSSKRFCKPHRMMLLQGDIKYISRYLGRPVIATSRIDAYDGTSVTFHYQRHEDHETVTECIPAIDFIKRLIVHIPDRHFKMVRYYGIYANTINRKKISGNVYPLRNSVIFPGFWIGVIQSFWLLAMIRSDARSVALLCWF